MFEPSFWIEAFGYIASIIVVISFAMTSVKKLRIINGVGCILSVIYGIIIQAYPVVLMNLVIAALDFYQLHKLRHVHSSFELVPADPSSAYFQWFSSKYADDLAFDSERRYASAEKLFFYVRDNEVAGILAYNQTGSNSADIVMDYVIAKFRDCKIGRFFFCKESPYFCDLGITKFTTRLKTPNHEGYLRQIGFVHQSGDVWTKGV